MICPVAMHDSLRATCANGLHRSRIQNLAGIDKRSQLVKLSLLNIDRFCPPVIEPVLQLLQLEVPSVAERKSAPAIDDRGFVVTRVNGIMENMHLESDAGDGVLPARKLRLGTS